MTSGVEGKSTAILILGLAVGYLLGTSWGSDVGRYVPVGEYEYSFVIDGQAFVKAGVMDTTTGEVWRIEGTVDRAMTTVWPESPEYADTFQAVWTQTVRPRVDWATTIRVSQP